MTTVNSDSRGSVIPVHHKIKYQVQEGKLELSMKQQVGVAWGMSEKGHCRHTVHRGE